MDGRLNVGDVLQVIDLDVDLVVALLLGLGFGHVVVDLLQHLHVLNAQHNAALGPVALGAVRLQHAHDLQLPAAGLFGGLLAGPDGQGHLILVDVHKGRQLLAVGIGLALPAVALGAVVALARVLKLIPGGPADQNLQFRRLLAGGGVREPAAALQGEAHRLQCGGVDADQIVNFHRVAVIAARRDGALQIIRLRVGRGRRHVGDLLDAGDGRVVQIQRLAVAADHRAVAVDLHLGQVAPALQHLLVGFGLGNAQRDHQHDHAGADDDADERQRRAALAAQQVARRQADFIRDLHRCPLLPARPVPWPFCACVPRPQ